MMQTAALLKPAVLTLKNRVRSDYKLTRRFGRDLIIVLLSIITAIAMYRGALATVSAMQRYANLTWLPPAFPLALLFLTIFIMLLISNTIAALGALYYSRDLEFVLAAPVSPGHFFAARFLNICAASSWMVFVFAFPAIAGFGQAYGGGWGYYSAAAFLLIPFFVLASSVSILITTVCASLIAARKAHQLVLISTTICLGCFLYLLTVLLPASQAGSAEQVLYFLSVISVTNSLWAPSYWLATPLGEILQASGRSLIPYVTLLTGSAAGTLCLAYLSVRLLHRRAYSQTHGGAGSVHRSRFLQKTFSHCFPFIKAHARGLLLKELKVNSRDMIQVLQFLMLLGLCMIYLYNFRMLHSVNALPPPSREWWRGILVFMNLGMGGFVLTAVCSRFIYPSISLEGRAFWLLQAAPISALSVLRTRFWFWYIPAALLGCCILIIGSSAIDPAAEIVVINIFVSLALCSGMVSLALGIGALFADFEWEHASQLAASFGSLVFMMASIVLILASMVPIGVLIFVYAVRSIGYGVSVYTWYTCAGLSIFLLAYLNFLVSHWALQLGEQALRKRA